MRNLTSEARRHEASGDRMTTPARENRATQGPRVIARDPVIGSSGHPAISESVGTQTEHDVSTSISIPVILSGARSSGFTRVNDRRGVEGSRHSLVSPCGIKAFSRELPDAPAVTQASSGSFDSPSSRFAELRVAQDDSSGLRLLWTRYDMTIRRLRDTFGMFIAVLREIFDEAAYERFLARNHTARSVQSYREFLRDREAALQRKPRCC